MVLEECYESCLNEPDCTEFSIGTTLGCAISKCGS